MGKMSSKAPVERVRVVDVNCNDLAPTNPGKAARMLRRGKAIVYKRSPFTIKLKKAVKDVSL